MKRKSIAVGAEKSPKKARQGTNQDLISGNDDQDESPRFPYGNFLIDRWPNESRLDIFQRHWFENRDVLDVGCNAGFVTLAVALVFRPSKIVGVDIDGRLIESARKNLSLCQQMMQEQKLRRRCDSVGSRPSSDYNIFPVSMIRLYGPLSPPNLITGSTSNGLGFCRSVNFVYENYVLDKDEDLESVSAEFDTITAFGVTKWIHLNWGDDGLKRFFKRVFAQLRPGGYFILDLQPWASYKKHLKRIKARNDVQARVTVKPENFSDYLMGNEIGFAKHRIIYSQKEPQRDIRPLHMFEKGH